MPVTISSSLAVVFKHYYIPEENITAIEAELRQEDIAAISKKHQDKITAAQNFY